MGLGELGLGEMGGHLNFWALNANSSKIVKDTNLKFGIHAPRESPDMTSEKFFRKGGVARVT